MRIARVIFFVCTGVLLLTAQEAAGQQQPAYWLTRDTFNRYADSLVVKGRIIKYSGLYPQCGTACTSETFIFHLTEKCPDYPYPDVYVAFTCGYKVKDLLNDTVKLTLTKIALNDHRCFWEETFGTNPFDTKGLPFYELMEYYTRK